MPGGPGGRGGDADDDFGGDGRGWTRGRRVSAEDLQLMLLGLLEQNPSHGYELIKALGTLSNGFYTPSPGMVYPALTYLEELGYATVEQDGAKKRYSLAEPGRAYLDANRERLSVQFNKFKHIARKMDWMRQAWSGQPPDLGPEGEDRATGWVPEFVQARSAPSAPCWTAPTPSRPNSAASPTSCAAPPKPSRASPAIDSPFSRPEHS